MDRKRFEITPGFAAYNIGSPVFSRVQIALPGGKTFQIVAEGCSDDNKYIQQATLNGQPWNKPWLSHDDVAGGGILVLTMGKHPNKTWGADPQAAPPSADTAK